MSSVATPEHRTLLAIDVKKYGDPTRTDVERAHIRRQMYSIVQEACERIFGDLDRVTFGDSGDGLFATIEPLVPKSDVVGVLYPALLDALRHHNRISSKSSSMQWRVAVSSGELVQGPGPGQWSGEALNNLFRLLDSDPIRTALSDTRDDAVLIVSSHYYDTVVKHGYGRINPEPYMPVVVKQKEYEAEAWLLRPSDYAAAVSQGPTVSNNAPVREAIGHEQSHCRLADLDPRALYLGITDIHNYGIYAMEYPAVPLAGQIESALLLAPQAVMHCADPFRSRDVATLVTEFSVEVDEGNLLFLLGENTLEPAAHFADYIDLKIRQYSSSDYGTSDVTSLREVDADARGRTVAMLGRTPIALTRGFSGTDRFKDYALRDLRATEPIATYEGLAASGIANLDLTLRQLLQLRRVNPKGRASKPFAADETLELLMQEVQRLAQHESFSRQILYGAVKKAVTFNGVHEYLDLRLRERISQLHLRATIGDLEFLQISHRRDEQSPYFHALLLEHLAVLAGCPTQPRVGATLTSTLRRLEAWPYFRAWHLATASRIIRARRFSAGTASNAEKLFLLSGGEPGFASIRQALRKEWCK